jgi:hypothetical protein
MYICIYVYMYICMYICMYVYTYVCMYVCMYGCVYAYAVTRAEPVEGAVYVTIHVLAYIQRIHSTYTHQA